MSLCLCCSLSREEFKCDHRRNFLKQLSSWRNVLFPFLNNFPPKKLEGYICVLKVNFQGMIEKHAFSYLSVFTTTSHPQARSLPSRAHGGLVCRWWEDRRGLQEEGSCQRAGAESPQPLTDF